MPAAQSADPRPAVRFSSLLHILEHQARRIPDAPAILAPGRAPLSYGRLYGHVEQTGRTLRALGIGCHDRVAVVLPNGPEMAVAILAVAGNAACAPINPAYEADELDRYFADLRPCALIAEARVDSPARRAALSRGIRVVELGTESELEAGLFTLGEESEGALSHGAIGPGEVALLLLTSGTTSQPKIVPLTHANICTSAYSWVAALALTETDRCLNITPLFHGNVTANVLASLAAGASVVWTPGSHLNCCASGVPKLRPTWYAAVPTMHQAILTEARHHRECMPDYTLRFIRSSSAPLPAHIFAELERVFATSVIEAYGMTETASAPIACNPLAPGRRKPGSVGMPVGLDVAVMDEEGALLPGGRTGQVVVRGASVMRGYDGDPLATQAAFVGDWFKTGDDGYFDGDGYLFLAGRSKEIINRGGEKIAPSEVDEALLAHPAVVEAVSFAVPHPTLGEDITAAVVLRTGAIATPNDLRRFVAGRIADFKVPRQVLIVRELPKGPTGKIQRIGLPAKLGLTSDLATPRTYIPPRTPMEKMLAGCWAEILQVERVGVHDDFFALGGDSLLVAHAIARVHDVMHFDIEISRFFEAPTIAELARDIEMLIEAGEAGRSSAGIVRASREDGAPASIAQERLCRLQGALPNIPFFNILHPLRVTSPIDAAVLERSLNEIVRRHEILRTTFAVIDGRCVQVIAPQSTVPLMFDDLQALPEPEREAAGHQLLQQELLHSFELARGPLFRVRLVRLAEGEHLLLITMHQVICDGWSLGVLADELFTVYDAFSAQAESPLVALPIQYADFAYWQRRWRAHPGLASQLAYWRAQLRGPLHETRLASPGQQRISDDLRTAQRELALPVGLSEAAKRFSQREGGTLFMALLTGLKILLYRRLGQQDVRVAALVANRNRPGTERLIGPVANMVILRTNLGGDPSPREIMRRVRATTLAALANQDLPFEELVENLDPALDPTALASVVITLRNAALRPMASSDHALAFEEANPSLQMPVVRVTTFDIILALSETVDGLAGTCAYKPHLFDATTIDQLLQDFSWVLDQMVMQPDRSISSIPVPLNRRSNPNSQPRT